MDLWMMNLQWIMDIFDIHTCTYIFKMLQFQVTKWLGFLGVKT